jgi:hypothetical protein
MRRLDLITPSQLCDHEYQLELPVITSRRQIHLSRRCTDKAIASSIQFAERPYLLARKSTL